MTLQEFVKFVNGHSNQSFEEFKKQYPEFEKKWVEFQEGNRKYLEYIGRKEETP